MSSKIISLITCKDKNGDLLRIIDEIDLKFVKLNSNTQNSTTNESETNKSSIQSSEKVLLVAYHVLWKKWIRCVKLPNGHLWAIDHSQEIKSSMYDKTALFEDPFLHCLPAVNVKTEDLLNAIGGGPNRYEDALMRLNYGLAFYPDDKVDWNKLIDTMEENPLETMILNEYQFRAIHGVPNVEDLIEFIFTVRHKITGKIVIICSDESEAEFLINQFEKSGVSCTELRPESIEQSTNIRDIFVCADGLIDSCYAWGASYFIHYSLPYMPITFMKRFIRYYGFYINKAKLGGTPDDIKLPVSYVYFDFNVHAHHWSIFKSVEGLENIKISQSLQNEVKEMKEREGASNPQPGSSDVSN